jgi:hypothetical protein
MRWYPSYPMGSGRCCAPGCAHTAAFPRRSCPSISASFNSSTIPASVAKPCSAPSLPPWSHDQTSITLEPRESQCCFRKLPNFGKIGFLLTNDGAIIIPDRAIMKWQPGTARISLWHVSALRSRAPNTYDTVVINKIEEVRSRGGRDNTSRRYKAPKEGGNVSGHSKWHHRHSGNVRQGRPGPLPDRAHVVRGDYGQLCGPGHHRHCRASPVQGARPHPCADGVHFLSFRLVLRGRADPRRLAARPLWLENHLLLEHLYLVALHLAPGLGRPSRIGCCGCRHPVYVASAGRPGGGALLPGQRAHRRRLVPSQ